MLDNNESNSPPPPPPLPLPPSPPPHHQIQPTHFRGKKHQQPLVTTKEKAESVLYWGI